MPYERSPEQLARDVETKRRYWARRKYQRLGTHAAEADQKQNETGGNVRKGIPGACESVICGDARDLVKSLPNDAFLISDPPYNQGYHYDNYVDNLELAEYMELIRIVFQGRRSVIVHYPEETINVLSRSGLGQVQDVMAWVYPSNQGKQHRLATWWNCKPNWKKTPQPYKNPTDRRVAKLIASGKQARGYDWVEMNHVKNVAKLGHPCPLPYPLAQRLVLATTEPGDLVCDPFAGSGTVLLAALKNGRRAIGFELSEAYCDLARQTIRAVS